MLEEVIARRRRDFTSGFISESPAKPPVWSLLRCHGRGTPEVECNAPWVSAVVEADGAVRPASSAWAAFMTVLEQLLNSPEARVFRRGWTFGVIGLPPCVCT